MDDLTEVGRPVFLHFLDRETATTPDECRSESEDICVIETLLICHSGGLSINLHPLALYADGKPALLECVLKLNKSGILLNTSHDRNITRFIDSRQLMYAGVAESVPIFFRDADLVSKFTIHKPNSYSMTNLIRADVFGYPITDVSSFAPRAKPDDKQQFERNLDTVQNVLYHNKHAAITVDNIAHFANTDELPAETLDSMRRVLSALYHDHYCERNFTITATGVPRLTSLADNYTYFPHYDIPVLQGLVSALEWAMLVQKVVGLREHLLQTYGSVEHRTFVVALNAFLCGCAAQAKSTLQIAAIAGDSAPAARSTILHVANIALGHAKALRALEFNDIRAFYRTAEELLISASTFAASQWPSFRSAWDRTAVAHSYIPRTGFPNLDRRLAEIRDRLRFLTPLLEREIGDTLALLAPLANFAQQAVQRNIFKTAISEAEFQEQITHTLRSHPQIGGELEEHPHVGGGITDLSFRGIRIELKSVSNKRMKAEDCRPFVNQALTYGVASGARVSVLCVLDCSRKTQPPFPVEDGIDVVISQESRSPMFVITVLIQGNHARPSSHSP